MTFLEIALCLLLGYAIGALTVILTMPTDIVYIWRIEEDSE